MRKRSKTVLAGIVLAAVALTGCAAAEETPVEDESSMVEESPAGTIIDVAVASGSFNTLASALAAADLVDTLQGDGPFTVFAPTDEAFANLPEGVLDALLLPENIEILKSILTYHVVSGQVMAADVTTGDVTSVEGSSIALDTSNGVVLNGSATVTTADVAASNGVIHIIDAVILPPDVDVAALLG